MLGVELDAFFPLDMKIAVKGIVPASEGEHRHRRRHANVDPDHPRFDSMLEFARGFAGVGENGGAVAVGGFVRQFHGVIEILHSHDIQDRAEDLFASDRHFILHVVDDGCADKESVRRVGDMRIAAVANDFGAFFLATCDQAQDVIAMLRGDDRPHVGLRV